MAEEDFPAQELTIPDHEALAQGVRAIIEECVENTVASRELRHEAWGISDDQTRRKIMQADGYDKTVATIVGALDKHLPNPKGGSWLTEIGLQADALEDQRFGDGDG